MTNLLIICAFAVSAWLLYEHGKVRVGTIEVLDAIATYKHPEQLVVYVQATLDLMPHRRRKAVLDRLRDLFPDDYRQLSNAILCLGV